MQFLDKFTLYCIALPLFARAVNGKVKTLIFQRVVTTFNPTFVDSYNVSVGATRRSLDLDFRIIEDLPVDFWLQIDVIYVEAKASAGRSLFSYDLNMCSLLGRGLNKIHLINTWMSALIKTSNFPKACPLAGGYYYWRDMRVEKEALPPFILNGKYRVHANFYLHDLNDTRMTNATLFIKISEKS